AASVGASSLGIGAILLQASDRGNRRERARPIRLPWRALEVPMTARIARLALAVVLASSAAARAADVKLETEDEKTVYALGYKSPPGLERLAMKPDEIEVFLSAIRDGLTGKKAPIDVDTYAGKVQAFAQARAAEGSKVEKAASAEFLAKEAAAPGATKSST